MRILKLSLTFISLALGSASSTGSPGKARCGAADVLKRCEAK